MELLKLCICIGIVAISLIYWCLCRRFSYWADRGVVHDKPVLLYGNSRGLAVTVPLFEPFRSFYLRYRGQAPFGGFYLYLRRAAVIFDLELVKNILIRDFQYFAHRGQYYNEQDDPLTGHIFNLDGPKWKNLRAKLTPTFTSGKMKFMFPRLVAVAEELVKVLEELLMEHEQNGDEWCLEVKDLLERYTVDVIGSCAFGLECNSLKDPKAKFRQMGQRSFRERRHGPILNAFLQAFPEWGRKLHIKMVPDEINEFFMGVVRDTVRFREQNNIKRNDFLDLLIELKNNKDTEGLTLEEIAAQAFVFFLAGFETSSSTMSFTLYELALNQDMQDKARCEIQEAIKRHNGQLTYEAMCELKYLHQVLYESLRKYPIASLILRKTVQDYPVPNTQFVIEKGTIAIIPIDAIHHDPLIYPDPEKFDPARFAREEVEKRHSMSWLPFGDGPRNCIGLRFGKMQSIVGLTLLLLNFRFSPGKETEIPLQIEPKGITLTAKTNKLRLERL